MLIGGLPFHSLSLPHTLSLSLASSEARSLATKLTSVEPETRKMKPDFRNLRPLREYAYAAANIDRDRLEAEYARLIQSPKP